MTDDQNEPDDDPGRLRRMYEEASQARAQSDAKVAELERREAFRGAGLDLTNPLHQDVAEAYKGELDIEKVREHVASRGLNLEKETPPPPPPQTPQAEREAIERIANAGAGEGTPPVEPDRVATIKQDMAAAARQGNQGELDRLSVELARATGNPIVQQ